jgi:hypothetical protein
VGLRAAAAIGAVAGVALAGLVLWVVLGSGASWLLEHADKVDADRLADKDRADSLDRIRGRAIALGTGLLAMVAIFFTARTAAAAHKNADALRRNSEASHRTAEAAEQGMVTGRYTAAIEQLGSSKLDIRLGGVYALERIARDSARDHPVIVEVLTTFLREHIDDDSARISPADPMITGEGDASAMPSLSRLRADLRAAANVLGRRNRSFDYTRPPDLTGFNLSRLDLSQLNLRGTDLHSTDLHSTALHGAYLGGANLYSADLRGADLRGTELHGADLGSADLRGVNLRDANLGGANLRGVNLRDADLTRTNLRDADLCDADLTLTNLRGADLSDADLRGVKGYSPQQIRATAVTDDLTRFDPLPSSPDDLPGTAAGPPGSGPVRDRHRPAALGERVAPHQAGQ